MPVKADFIEAMRKHLPPSASELHLLDIGGVAGEILSEKRQDLEIEVASLLVTHWDYSPDSFDSILAYDCLLKADLLSAVLDLMRPGGRFIIVNPDGQVDESIVRMLENAGYIRILVEPAVGDRGILIRGEKAHTTADTLERVESVASRDADLLDLENYKGRYVHLLIIQRPNKPVWKLEPGEKIEWYAVAIQKEGRENLLAFTSLPKAVSFMQPAVMSGFVRDVNKVGKFSKATASTWEQVALLNPTLPLVEDFEIELIRLDPETAEISDE